MCDEAVGGRYYRVAERAACAKCYDACAHCAGCGMPLKEARFTRRGEPVCDSCAQRAGACANCGDVLLGTYYPAKDDPAIRGFCQRCMEEKPKCAICGAPYRDLVKAGENLLCRRCLKQAERCETCAAPIAGRFFVIEGLDGKFCRKCIEDRNWCDFCGRPPGRDGAILPDGRRTCGPCSRSAVDGIDRARDLLERTIRYLSSRHGMRTSTPFDFVLADSELVARLTGRGSSAPPETGDKTERAERDAGGRRRGPALRELGVFATHPFPESSRPMIAILSGLPVSAFLETAAHEYAHLWQFENGLDLRDQVPAEGLAQWAAAKWLLKNRLEAAYAQIAKRDDPVYGAGYRRVADYEQAHGTDKVLDWVRKEMRAAPPEFAMRWPLVRGANLRAGGAATSERTSATAAQDANSFLESAIVVQPAGLSE